jgi:hypothetical protein
MRPVTPVRSIAVLCVGAVAVGALAAPATTAAPKPKPDKAFAAQSVPAAGSAATGSWVVWTTASGRSSATTMKMPGGVGVPLLADWNGDGVATPGRYDAGQWFITNAAVDSALWEAKVAFGGEPGDVPVTGQIDKDHKTDFGIFRAGTWLWRLGDGKPDRSDQFGAAGDVPIVGDWNGDGRDDIGVVRGGSTWILRMDRVDSAPSFPGVTVSYDAATRSAQLQFTFGDVGDVPVVGDWDRDGRAEPGVVRGGRTWILASGLANLGKTATQTHVLGTDQVPLVGRQSTAPGHCPTATVAGEEYGARAAMKVKLALTPKGGPQTAGSPDILPTLKDGLRYVVNNDWTKRLVKRADRRYYDPLSTHKTQEESIRRSANAALAAAIFLTTTTKKANVPGVSRAQLLSYVRWHIRSVACQHGALSPGGWGNTWQSALWAVTLGQAGWLLWPDLDPYEQSLVAAMVVSEAEYASARGPRYFRNRLNQELTPGDSQSDEVSWDLMAPALALAMMPHYGSAPEWRDALIAMAIAAFARPQDLQRAEAFNGVRLDIRLPGTNANEDGTVTNHGIVNPDYTQNVEHLWWAASLLRTGSRPVPEALFVNADIVYRALALVNFPSPPYAAPGGTVYQPLGQIYYPMGVSWGVRRPATFVGVDAFANQYAAPDAQASVFLAAHAADTRALQKRWADGHIYAPGNTEDSYKLGKEEYALQQMALAWWAGAVGQKTRMVVDRKAYPGISLGVGAALS